MLRYEVEGDIAHLVIQPMTNTRVAHRLWEHTCFEAFVKVDGSQPYHEFNFSPSTEWAAYRFTQYRRDMSEVELRAPPGISVGRGIDRFSLDVVVELDGVLDLPDSAQLQIALSAVIEENDRRMSYWALAHPDGKPDFHHAAGFVLLPG
jgi:hypothetical protein